LAISGAGRARGVAEFRASHRIASLERARHGANKEEAVKEYQERLEEFAWHLLDWNGEIDDDLSPESNRFPRL